MKKKSYQQLKAELDEILSKLESQSLDIDEAFILHEKGQKLAVELEKYLKQATVKVEKLKPKRGE